MSLSVFVWILMPFFLAPFWTHELLKKSFERQKAIIALDNAAILLGREDRDLFNFINKTNSFVSELEKIHHPVHLAIRMGLLDPKLKAQDLSLEGLIRELHSQTGTVANMRWIKAVTIADSEISRMGVSGRVTQRASKVPISEKVCTICHLFINWKQDSGLLKSRIEVDTNGARDSLWVWSTHSDPVSYKVSINTQVGL